MEWHDAIDVSEHHQIDFDEVRRQGTTVVVVRAGRGTRQDSRWVEHVRAAEHAGLAVGSYWHLYPSRTSAHHQAQLWGAAVAVAPSLFPARHWLHVATTDGFGVRALAAYVRAGLQRMDEVLGQRTGVSTAPAFWQQRVRLDLSGRPLWLHPPAEDLEATGAVGFCTCPADRGGPGRHRVRDGALRVARLPSHGLHLVPRGSEETVASWQRRWLRTPDVAVLQQHLNELGADLEVDGVYGPATDAAVRTWHDLCRRDLAGRLPVPARPPALSAPARTTHR